MRRHHFSLMAAATLSLLAGMARPITERGVPERPQPVDIAVPTTAFLPRVSSSPIMKRGRYKRAMKAKAYFNKHRRPI